MAKIEIEGSGVVVGPHDRLVVALPATAGMEEAETLQAELTAHGIRAVVLAGDDIRLAKVEDR